MSRKENSLNNGLTEYFSRLLKLEMFYGRKKNMKY